MFKRQQQYASLLSTELDAALRVIRGGNVGEDEAKMVANTFSAGIAQVFDALPQLNLIVDLESSPYYRDKGDLW